MYMHLPDLVETRFAASISAASISGSPEVVTSFGTDSISMPLCRIQTESASELPDSSGNYLFNVKIEVLGSVDYSTGGDLAAQIEAHQKCVGAIFDHITSINISSLSGGANFAGSSTASTNSIEIYHARVAGLERDNDTAEGLLVDTINLEIYANEA